MTASAVLLTKSDPPIDLATLLISKIDRASNSLGKVLHLLQRGDRETRVMDCLLQSFLF